MIPAPLSNVSSSIHCFLTDRRLFLCYLLHCCQTNAARHLCSLFRCLFQMWVVQFALLVSLLAHLDLTPCHPCCEGFDSMSAFHSGGLTLCHCYSLNSPGWAENLLVLTDWRVPFPVLSRFLWQMVLLNMSNTIFSSCLPSGAPGFDSLSSLLWRLWLTVRLSLWRFDSLSLLFTQRLWRWNTMLIVLFL